MNLRTRVFQAPLRSAESPSRAKYRNKNGKKPEWDANTFLSVTSPYCMGRNNNELQYCSDGPKPAVAFPGSAKAEVYLNTIRKKLAIKSNKNYLNKPTTVDSVIE